MSEMITMRPGWQPIERVTQGILGIDSNHAQIHAGNGYSFGEIISIAAGATANISIQVPANAYVHYQAHDISTDGGNELTVNFFEGAVLNAVPGGTAIVPVNRHRIGTPPVSVLTILKNPTITSNGGLLDPMFLPKTASAQTKGFSSKSDSIEWVLNPGTTYLLSLANTGAVTTVIANYRPFWYEEEGA